MILNGSSFCLYNNKKFLLDRDISALFHSFEKKEKCEFLCELPSSELNSLDYIDVVACGRYIVCIPCRARFFTIYDTLSGKSKIIEVISRLRDADVNITNINFLFGFAIVYAYKVIAFGSGADCIVCLSPDSGKLTINTSLMRELRKAMPRATSFFRRDVADIGKYLYLSSLFDGKIICLNMEDYTYQINALTDVGSGYIGVAAYDGLLWLLRRDGFLMKCDADKFEVSNPQIITNFFKEQDIQTGRFFSFNEALIYLDDQHDRILIYFVAENRIKIKKVPYTPMPPSGIARWPKVICKDDKCYLIDSRSRDFIVIDDNYVETERKRLQVSILQRIFAWDDMKVEKLDGMHLRDLIDYLCDKNQGK